MKKFELTTEYKINIFGKKLYRIKALVDFGTVKAGDLGGFIEKEDNVSMYGNAWVYDDACVYDEARVLCNAEVCDCARIHDDTDYTTIKGIGENFGCMTFFRCKDGLVRVNCDFFFGTIQEFRKVVTKTIDSQFAKEYLMIANLMEYHFKMDLMDLKFKMFY